MRKISTGQDSILATYKEIASVFGERAVKFIQDKIDASPNGGNEEVIADERQMLYLFSKMMDKEQ